MSIEYTITMIDRPEADTNLISTDATIQPLIPPTGVGWRLMQMMVGTHKIFLTWMRGSGTVAISANYIADERDDVILADASNTALTVTLPAADAALKYTVKKIDNTGNIVYVTSSSGLIDGGVVYPLNSPMTSIDLVSNGIDWFVV